VEGTEQTYRPSESEDCMHMANEEIVPAEYRRRHQVSGASERPH
jgi:hypothetical protein